MRICIDAGHGGWDSGALGLNSRECDINLAIAEFLEIELQDQRHDTLMTRRGNRNLSLIARAEFANRHNADLFVSIHCNGADNKSASGIETWVYPFAKTSHKAAQLVQAALMGEFPCNKNRGVKEANFVVLRETQMRAIMVECEFITNRTQERRLNCVKTQQRYAKAIAAGILV